MKNRFRLFIRGKEKGKKVYYAFDNRSSNAQSLKTEDKKEAQRLLHALNEANQQPEINQQIARGYLLASDPRYNERTWQYVCDMMTAQKAGSTKQRWGNVAKDKALAPLWKKTLVLTKADDLLDALTKGTVSTNVFLRRMHNFAVAMAWLPVPILPKKQWPEIRHREKRAITFEEHRKIVEREQNPERKAFYELCWHFGGSQGDIAKLCAEDIDWDNGLLFYRRSKTKVPAKLRFGREAEAILRTLPKSGFLFPYLKGVRSADRATEFSQRCKGLGIQGVTLHSYRFAFAQRAKKAGYPERYAGEALGHNSKALIQFYSRNADMTLPSLEDYEKQMAEKVIALPTEKRSGAESKAVGE